METLSTLNSQSADPAHMAMVEALHNAIRYNEAYEGITKALDLTAVSPDSLAIATGMDHSRQGDVEFFRFLLQSGATQAQDSKGLTPLHLAMSIPENADVGALFVEYGANVDAYDAKGKAPLHYAVGVDKDNVQFLLDKGANFDIKDEMGNTPLLELQNSTGFKFTTTKMLVDRGADLTATNSKGDTPLLGMARCLDHRAMTYLLESGAPADTKNHDGENALHLVAGHPSRRDNKNEKEETAILESVKLLLSKGTPIENSNPNRHNDGLSPLHLAALYGRAKVCGLMLDNGAQVDAPSGSGDTALHWAARHHLDGVYAWERSKHDYDVTATLLVLDSYDANFSALNNKGETPKMVAEKFAPKGYGYPDSEIGISLANTMGKIESGDYAIEINHPPSYEELGMDKQWVIQELFDRLNHPDLLPEGVEQRIMEKANRATVNHAESEAVRGVSEKMSPTFFAEQHAARVNLKDPQSDEVLNRIKNKLG